jgi:hypothetical protein
MRSILWVTVLGLGVLAPNARAGDAVLPGIVRSPDGDFLDSGAVAGRPTIAIPDDGSADGWDATAVIAGAAGRDDGGAIGSAGELGADAVAISTGHTDLTTANGLVGRAAAGASVRGRAGTAAAIGASSWAQLGYRWLPDRAGRGLGLLPITLSHDGDLGALPGLGARRDRARGGYDREQLGVEFVGLQIFWPGHRIDGMRMGLGGAWSTGGVGAAVRRQTGAHAEGLAYCWLRGPRPDACLRFMAIDMLGVEGGSSAAIGSFAPARISGIPLGGGVYLDATAGGSFLGTMTISSNGRPVHTIMTEDLPDIAAGTYDLRLVRAGGPIALETRARRELYVSTEGDLSLEDRAEVALTMSGSRTSVTARAFAARTRWWSSKTDPGTTSDTGGGELALARRLGGFELDATAGVARTFYGALDGAAVGAPSLGARGTIALRRSLR